MTNDLRALVVGASAEELAHIEQCLPAWECVSALLNVEESSVSSVPGTVKLIIVCARKSKKNTLSICEQLRNSLSVLV